MRVDVVGLGVQKAGTTWLFRNLVAHPELAGPQDRRKEINFFNFLYHLGYGWYHSQFDERKDAVLAEFSPLYAASTDTPARLHRYRSDIRMVLCLRNPAERAYSQHLHCIRLKDVAPVEYDFLTAMRANPSYIEQGRFGDMLERLLSVFEREQLHIVLFDDLKANPLDTVQQLYTFVGATPSYVPPLLDSEINKAEAIRNMRLERRLRKVGKVVRQAGGEHLGERVKELRVVRRLRSLNRDRFSDLGVPALDERVRSAVAEALEDQIITTGRILDRDLSHWLPS